MTGMTRMATLNGLTVIIRITRMAGIRDWVDWGDRHAWDGLNNWNDWDY